MALIDSSVVDFVETLNRQTLVPLDHRELILSPVFPKEDIRTTQLRLTTTGEYQYRGSEILTYERLDLAYLDTLFFTIPRFYPRNGTLYSVLPDLADGIGIRFDEEDVFDAVITEAEGLFTVNLVAKPGSYRWFGEYVLRFRDLPRLDSIIDYDHVTW